MRKSLIPLLLLISGLALYSQSALSQKIADSKEGLWNNSDTIKIWNFIRILKIRGPIDSMSRLLVIDDNFPRNFVKRSDVETLFISIKSKEKCKCTFNPLSSYLPSQTDSAELGGYIISLIKSYKNKTRFSVGLYSCPTMNEKEADYLIAWWAKNKTH